MLKVYRYRIYPNKTQAELIQKTFGCCRFVYNNTLAYRKDLYSTAGKHVGKYECNNYCTRVLKKQNPWLNDVDKFALTNSIWDMDFAYKQFFKGNAKFPKYKSKKNRKQSYKTNFSNNNIFVDFNNGVIKLPKLKYVKAKLHRTFSGNIKSATIVHTPSDKYYVSVLVESQNIEYQHSENTIGIDLGLKRYITTSNGDSYDNIRAINKYEQVLKREQEKLSGKVYGSKNYEKQRLKVARVNEKIANVRSDFLHKLSKKLVCENQVIISEDLNVKNMLKDHYLSKAICDCAWSEFIDKLEYKSKQYGRVYIKVDKYFASSQFCSDCGWRNQKIKDLSIREWVCPNCGSFHDRDINAAKNILNEGLRILSEST